MRQKRLLIVDDDLGVQDAYTTLFEHMGYEVQVCNNGSSILNNTLNKVDVILLDWQLSGASGLEVCRYIKAQEHTRKIPVIMISASSHVGIKAIEAGAEVFLEKPISIYELTKVVSYWANLE